MSAVLLSVAVPLWYHAGIEGICRTDYILKRYLLPEFTAVFICPCHLFFDFLAFSLIFFICDLSLRRLFGLVVATMIPLPMLLVEVMSQVTDLDRTQRLLHRG